MRLSMRTKGLHNSGVTAHIKKAGALFAAPYFSPTSFDFRIFRMKRLGVLLALQAAIAAASLSKVDTAQGTLTLEGRQKRGAEANIAGSFRSTEGDGIRFRSTPHSLEVKTTDGKILVRTSRLSAFAQTVGAGDEMAVYQILDDVYAKSNERLYRSEDIDIDARGHFSRSQLLANLQITELADPQAALQASVDELVAHPAIRLLEPAARALGEDLGVIGKDEPAAMPFYTTAMRLTEVYNRNLRAKVSLARNANPWDSYYNRPVTAQGKYPNCDLKACPPCKEDFCLGLCGYSCNCWWFTCGDCCYHEGCKDHDLCCRGETFSYTGCLFPLYFKCDEPYKC